MDRLAQGFYITNQLRFPAHDVELVYALLAFANGAGVVISGDSGEVSRWSLWRTSPSLDERASHVELLRQMLESGPRSPRSPAALDGLPVSLRSLMRPQFVDALEGPLLPHQDFLGYVAHMHASTDQLLIGRALSFEYFRLFETVAAALAYGALLLMNPHMPYRKLLCRCRLPLCSEFYLARKNPKGGPPNWRYCDPRHGEDHHNSAERAAARKTETARRKHK